MTQHSSSFPYTKLQLAWLEDLETTQAPQCKAVLFDGTGYCCLGRAEVVMGIQPQAVSPSQLETMEGSDLSGVTCLSHAEWQALGLFDELGARGERESVFTYNTLTEMNDMGVSFKGIAAAIRAEPEEWFRLPGSSL